ncbi:prepilin-type N-terminal cleavage/methylation domain-containing protein [Rudaea sp.]|uniref:type IV pilus modification PilV family protein n=1 Tax=Rudaea sp. TaxID=2136325 RepID=UPI0032203CFB
MKRVSAQAARATNRQPLPSPAARRGGVAARRASPSFHKSGGFTLIELIAAFVVFALGFGVLMQILGGALRTTRQSAEATQAALYAQSLLDVQGIGQPLKEGGGSGDFDNTYHWQLNVQRYQPQAAPGSTLKPALPTPGQPELFQLELIVSWGNQYLQHHARFVTLRAMLPPQPGSNHLPNGLPPGFG